MDKKLLVSMMLIGLIAALAGAGLHAYFSDTETSEGNLFTAGTLNLVVNDTDPWEAAFINVTGLVPGDSGEVTIELTNAGSVGGYVCMWIKDVVNDPGTTPEPEPTPDEGELGANINITIWLDDDGDNILDAGEPVYYEDVPLNDLNNTKVVEDAKLGAEETLYIGFAWEIPSEVGNEIMGDSVTFTIEFVLSQEEQT